tara:strand:- start:1751 stop:2029 length:279 start_codon:yes stop_codon:yes gene_type:complete
MIEECIRNTFDVLTNRQTVEEILDSEPKTMFYGNPFEVEDEDINEMIEFFENTEEYEKCGELLELLKAKEFAEFDMFLENLRIKNGQTDYWI